MRKKKRENQIISSTATGAATLGGGALAIDYIKEGQKFKEAKKVNTKNINSFLKNVRPGDIILESDPAGQYSGTLGRSPVTDGNYRNKVLKIVVEKVEKIKFNSTIQAGGGGSRYHHAGVYLGNNKMGEMVGSGGYIVDVKGLHQKKRIIALRVDDNKKVGRSIASNARKLVKSDILYRSDPDLIKAAIKNNLTFSRKRFDDCLTCTDLVDESVSKATKKPYIKGHIATPTDILLSNKSKVVSSYRYGASTRTEKILNITGKTFRNAKYALLGAAAGGLMAAAYSAYKEKEESTKMINIGGATAGAALLAGGAYAASKGGGFFSSFGGLTGKAAMDASRAGKKGRWVTIRGRKVFIPS